jgi:hypothetical protein
MQQRQCLKKVAILQKNYVNVALSKIQRDFCYLLQFSYSFKEYLQHTGPLIFFAHGIQKNQRKIRTSFFVSLPLYYKNNP